MASKNTKYAIDLSNDGVSFWHRGEDKVWQLLGKVSLSSENFSNDIENLKTGYEPNCEDGKFAAQVRIPRSEVFVSEIDLEGLTGAAAISKTKSFLSEKTPYQAQDLIFDLENNGAGKTSYVAAIAKQTAKEAKEFILGYGFEANFYTSKIDKTEFPRNPRFYDGKPPIKTPPMRAGIAKEAPKKAEIDEIPTPLAPPKPTPLPPLSSEEKAADAQTEATTKSEPPAPVVNKADEKPLSASSSTNFASFETIRRKSLIAPNKNGSKIEPSIASTPPLPPRRMSIALPKPVEKTASGAVKNPVIMPQGGGAKTNTGGFLKPKYAMIAVVLILVALLYWFFTELFDGKEEIARLQETPKTAPTAIIEPDVLIPQVRSNDEAPKITIGAAPEAHQVPILEALKLAAAPEPLKVTKGSVSTTGNEQLITNEQVAQALDEIAQTADLEQEVVAVEPEAPASEGVTPSDQKPESANEITPPDLQTEVALADLIPTKNGTPGAEGITLYAGLPDIIPPRRDQIKISTDPLKNILPKMRSKEFEGVHKTETIAELTPETVTLETTAVTDEEITPDDTAQDTGEITPDLLALADPTLKSKLPKVRPSTILQKAKEAQNSLLTKADPELANLEPKIRPRNLSVPQKVLEPEIIVLSEINAAVQEAVRNIARPRARPRSLKKVVAKAKASAKIKAEDTRTATLTPSTAAGTSKPSANSPIDVQKEATERAGFSKRRISLIGVYGTASSRRALVRLPSGRYVKVKTGQRVSGWKVSAIGESSVRIKKGSRNQVLRMPK